MFRGLGFAGGFAAKVPSFIGGLEVFAFEQCLHLSSCLRNGIVVVELYARLFRDVDIGFFRCALVGEVLRIELDELLLLFQRFYLLLDHFDVARRGHETGGTSQKCASYSTLLRADCGSGRKFCKHGGAA